MASLMNGLFSHSLQKQESCFFSPVTAFQPTQWVGVLFLTHWWPLRHISWILTTFNYKQTHSQVKEKKCSPVSITPWAYHSIKSFSSSPAQLTHGLRIFSRGVEHSLYFQCFFTLLFHFSTPSPLLGFCWILEGQDQERMSDNGERPFYLAKANESCLLSENLTLTSVRSGIQMLALLFSLVTPTTGFSVSSSPSRGNLCPVRVSKLLWPTTSVSAPTNSTNTMTRYTLTAFWTWSFFNLKGKELFEQRCCKNIHIWLPSTATTGILQ